MAAQTRKPALAADERLGSVVASYLQAARPLQWTKNLLVFAGLIFSKHYGDLESWLEALLAFGAYCLASSAAYLFNDIIDVARDRAHPIKKSRPLAAGEITARGTGVAAIGLGTAAIACVIPLGPESVGLMLGFLALQVGYSLGLKHVALFDVVTIASLFVIRAAAGAAAIDVWISPWLVLCSGLLALFLALAKRRAELASGLTEHAERRPVLGTYTIELVDQLISVVAASTISAYSLYTFTASESSALMLTIPLVVVGLFRYLQLVHGAGRGEEPERVLVSDLPLLTTCLLWVVTAVLILTID